LVGGSGGVGEVLSLVLGRDGGALRTSSNFIDCVVECVLRGLFAAVANRVDRLVDFFAGALERSCAFAGSKSDAERQRQYGRHKSIVHSSPRLNIDKQAGRSDTPISSTSWVSESCATPRQSNVHTPHQVRRRRRRG